LGSLKGDQNKEHDHLSFYVNRYVAVGGDGGALAAYTQGTIAGYKTGPSGGAEAVPKHTAYPALIHV
jgi:hypothetical protein